MTAMTLDEIQKILKSDKEISVLRELYGSNPERLRWHRNRYAGLAGLYSQIFSANGEVDFYSSPGRTEVGGNHTDHNAGRVLAAAVNLDILALVGKTDDGVINIYSEGYPPIIVNTAELDVVLSERFTSTALARGVCFKMKDLGYSIGGFQATMDSLVPTGSGLSSSAAFELMVTTILNHLYNADRIDTITAARISQYAENCYFGKPCGLMDQTTCAVGGFVMIDFKDFQQPEVKKVQVNFSKSGYALAIVSTGGSHADLNEDYAAIEREMKAIAKALGGEVLREFTAQAVLEHIPDLHRDLSDRAILRALHFYADDARVVEQVAALEQGDFRRFLDLVIESGRSSWMLCQNIYSPQDPSEQGIALAQVVAQSMLAGKGAWRVHGGGFAGTIQAFVPEEMVERFIQEMEAIFGKDTCHIISIRNRGASQIKLA
jgi:galactokinase